MEPHRKGLLLEYFTIGYNMIEAVVSIFFGVLAGSPALFGFGLDSIVESLSGGVLVWRLRKHEGLSDEEEKAKEFKAVRFVSVTFFILGAWVLYESVKTLYQREAPNSSLPGIIIAIASLLVMPTLAYMKRKVGIKMGSKALIADSKETMVCAVLSVALLLGLGFNALLGWWWADPVAGLFIVAFLFKEGIEQWREAGEEDDDD
jgi:cation diffusion facilitator family transporter